MNNIVMDNIINIFDNNKSINLTIDSDTTLNIYANSDEGRNIDIIQNNNSKLIINYVGVTNCDILTNINVKIIGSNNKCVINYHVLGSSGFNKSKVCVKTLNNTKNNEIIENLKGLCDGGNILIEPILETDTNDVSASHFVTIGSFNKEDLIYLNSLGLNEETSKKILKKSFKLNIFSDNIKKVIKEREGNDE